MRIVNLHLPAFVPTFRRLGHEVLSLGTTADCDVTLAEPLSHKRFFELLRSRDFLPDLVFWCDACQPPWVFGFETLPAVTIGYSIDQYMHPWHVPYSAGFDAVFVAQKDYLPLFASPIDRPAAWMPLFCQPSRLPALDTVRDIPVSFVGTLDGVVNARRRPFLEAFARRTPLVVTTGDFVPVYGRSRLVLNQSAAGELNFRLFEAMACGAAVLTEETGNGLTELFTPGEELLTYPRGDALQAAVIARTALASPELDAIAASGRRKTLARHTVTTRARHILETATRLAAEGAPAKRQTAKDRVRAEVHKAYAFLATDASLALSVGERQFFLDMARR